MSEQMNMKLNELSIKLGILQTGLHEAKCAIEKIVVQVKELEEAKEAWKKESKDAK